MTDFFLDWRVEIGLIILTIAMVKTTAIWPVTEPYWAIIGYFTLGFLDYWYIARHERVDQLTKSR